MPAAAAAATLDIPAALRSSRRLRDSSSSVSLVLTGTVSRLRHSGRAVVLRVSWPPPVERLGDRPRGPGGGAIDPGEGFTDQFGPGERPGRVVAHHRDLSVVEYV